ncbi:hypothetical protein [Shrimp hemocyte iridescent virus]|uniref:MSV199 domain-containing protein n=2 Tax=Decapodiridovirus litopenaeus1 TaxID=3428192 RepID=A0A291B0L9_9VIRU|nr:hypothetical protein KM509_gp025 [Shrimp hemocyte iridescent virus]ATE87034.1 hypothetical protein [Shrimp hemocyte iridescent virus]
MNKKQWIIMGSEDFKEMVMCLRTKRAGDIRKYYLAVEKLFKMYCEYTHHFNRRKQERELRAEIEKKQKEVEKKDTRIDDLLKEIRDEKKLAKDRYDALMGEHAQANEDRERIMNDLRAVRRVAAPYPDNEGDIDMIAIVKMSPHYVWSPDDPGYYRRIHAIAVRIQKKSFNARLNNIKRAGNGTNQNAKVLVSFESPNSIGLFARLKESYSDMFEFESPVGIRYENEQDLVDAVNEIHRSRMGYPPTNA